MEQVLQQIDQRLAAKSGIANLTAAYVKARKKVGHAVKDRSNPHFKNDYATLESVLDSFTAPFLEEEIALIQAPGEITGDNASLTGLLIHGPSGEALSFRMQIPLGGKATAQSYGSALTYARRYQAAAVVGITQTDDDGETASAPREVKAPPKPKAKDPQAVATYAAKVEAILTKIEGMNKENFDALREEVKEFGDSKVIDAFQAKRNSLAKKKEAA